MRRNFLLIMLTVALLTLILDSRKMNITAQEETLIDQGKQELEAGNFEVAEQKFEEALETYRETGDQHGEAHALYYLAISQYNQKKYTSSGPNFQNALKIYRELADKVGESQAAHQLARNYHATGGYADAESFYYTALNVVQDQNEAGFIHLHLGDLYYEQLQYIQAIEQYAEAIQIFFALGDHANRADALLRIGDANYWQWQLDTALDNYLQANTLYAQLGNQEYQAITLHQIGNLYHHTGELVPALDYFQQALSLYIQTQNEQGESRVLTFIGDIYRQNGYPTAIDLLNEALEIQDSIGDQKGRSFTLNYLGEYYLSKSQYREARTQFEGALGIALPLDDNVNEAHAYHGIARATAWGKLSTNLREALDNFDYSLRRYRDELNDHWNTRRVFISFAWVWVDRQNFQEAEKFFNQALREAESVNDDRGKAEVYIDLAHYYELPGRTNHVQAISYYEDALRALNIIGDSLLIGQVNIKLGDLKLLDANYNGTREYYELALFEFENIDNALWQAIAHNRLGKILQLTGNYTEALTHYREALKLIEGIDDELRNEMLIEISRGLTYQYLGKFYLEIDLFEEAQSNLQLADSIQSNLGDENNLALTKIYQGDYFLVTGRDSEARDYYQQGLTLGTRTGNVRASALANLGLAQVLSKTGDPSENFNLALVGFRDHLKDKPGKWLIRTNMGLNALDNQHFEDAIAFFSEVMREAAEVRDFRTEGYMHLNLGAVYGAKKDYFGALESYRKAINAFRQGGDFYGEGQALESIGKLEVGRGRYTPGLDAYNQMLLVYQNAGDRTYQSLAYLRIGQLYQDQGRFEFALEAYQQALVAIDDHSDDTELQVDDFIQSTRSIILLSRGDTYRELGQFNLAQIDLEEAERTQVEVGDERGRSQTLIARGDLLLAQRQLTEAADAFFVAQDIAIDTGDIYVQGLALYGIARVYTADDDPTNQGVERTNYDLALNIFRKITPNPTRAREVLINWAFSFLKSGEQKQAQDYFFTAQNEAHEAQDVVGEGYALLEIGNLFASRLEFNDAMDYYTDAQRLFAQSKEWIGEGQALENMARINILDVKYTEALEQYQQMQILYRENGDILRLARTYSLTGEIYRLQARYTAALNQQFEGLAQIQQVQSNVSGVDTSALIAGTEAYIYRNIAAVQIAQGQYLEAEKNLRLARERANSAGNVLEQTIIDHLLGNILALKGDFLAARDLYEPLVSIYENLGERNRLGQLRLDLGDAYYGLVVNDRGTAQTEGVQASIFYLQAQGVGEELNDLILQAEAFWRLGRINNWRENDVEAEQYLNKALNIASDINSPTLQARILIELGLLAEEDNRSVEAESFYTQAISLVEDLHGDVPVQIGQVSFVAQNIVPYHRMVVQYSVNNPELAFQFAERARSRDFLFQIDNESIAFGSGANADLYNDWQTKSNELRTLRVDRQEIGAQREVAQGEEAQRLTITLTELDQRINDLDLEIDQLEEHIRLQDTVLAQFTQINVTDISSLQAIIPEDTTLLIYYVVPGSSVDDDGTVFAFAVSKTVFEVIPLNTTLETLSTAISGFNGERSFTDIKSPQLLYSQLIAPVMPHLTTEKLVLVPHGVLNYLSFAALTPDGQQYFGDQFTLGYAPSATVYTLMLAKQQSGSQGSGALVFGNPTTSNLPVLLGAENEAQQVATLLGVTPKVRNDATETLLIQDSQFVDVIHIAAHGRFIPENPLSTNLALAADSQQDGSLEVREIYGLSLQSAAPLVVLSACDTVTGVLNDGDELQGLTRAFLVSGARGVVASLWKVDDQATSLLMMRFHENRQNGMNEAAALQDAQRFIREHPDHPEWAAPNFWAAFILVGLP